MFDKTMPLSYSGTMKTGTDQPNVLFKYYSYLTDYLFELPFEYTKLKMSRTYPAQIKKLLDILSEDGVLVRGRVNYGLIPRKAFWKNVAGQLNNVEEGVHKSTCQWWKVRNMKG